MFTKQLLLWKDGLDDFVAHPLGLLCEIIRTLDAESRSAVALIFMRSGSLPSPIEMTEGERRAVALLGGSTGSVVRALSSLDGSLLIRLIQNGGYVWRYKHPTIRDAFATIVAENTELMDIYLAGAPIEKLFREVSCGDVGIQGVKIIVSTDRFETVIARIATLDITSWSNRWDIHGFLAQRCNREFLSRFITLYPDFIPSLKVGSYLWAISDINVIVRLHEFGLLPDQKRAEVVSAIRQLAVDTPDSGFLQKRIRDMLTENEVADILEQVRTTLLPNLDGHIDSWRSSYDGTGDPEEHFSYLKTALTEYRDALSDSADALVRIESALADIDCVVEEMRSQQPEDPDTDDDYYDQKSSSSDDDISRSLFDDVDL